MVTRKISTKARFFNESKFHDQFLRQVGCLPPCRLPTYDLVVKTNYETPAAEGSETVLLGFYAPRASRTMRREYVVYNAAALLGDVGGMVGMLLGASALGLYDLAHRAVSHCFKTKF